MTRPIPMEQVLDVLLPRMEEGEQVKGCAVLLPRKGEGEQVKGSVACTRPIPMEQVLDVLLPIIGEGEASSILPIPLEEEDRRTEPHPAAEG